MRKKFLAMYALVGALVASPIFTSCVDDAESPSVTSIRNAKAEQLKALAALQTAQAEAAKITADAEAAYKAAQAAYQEALAESYKADAAHQAELTKQAQEKFVIELEKIKAQAEQEISYAKLQAMKNMASIEDFENEELKDLYVELQGAVAQLNNLNAQKLNTTNWYNQAKEGLVNTEAQKDYQVKRYDKLIAQEEFKIATYEKYEGADIEKLKNDRTIAEKEALKLQEAAIPYQEARNEAWDKYYEANEAYHENNNGFNVYWEENVKELALFDLIKEFRNKTNYHYWELNFARNEIFVDDSKLLAADYEIPYYTLDTEKAALLKEYYALEVDRKKDDIGTPAVAATETTAAVEATGMYREIENYKESIENAKKDIEAYQKSIEEHKAALKDNPDETWREWEISSLESSISYRNQYITDWQNSLEQVELRIESAKLELANLEANVTEVATIEAAFAADSEEMVAYEAAIAAQKALADAAVAAKEAAEKADEELEAANDKTQEKWDEYNVLNNKINNSADVEQIIADCQNNINNYKSWKQSWLNNVANGETNIAVYEAELETIEAQIEAQEAIIANLQAEIDALTATEEA